MSRVRIQGGGRAPAEIEQSLEKAVQAARIAQDRDFHDPVMQQAYEQERELFDAIFEAMAADIAALK